MNDSTSFWKNLRSRYDELANLVSSSSLDAGQRATVQKEFSCVNNLLIKHDTIERLKKEQQELHTQAQQESDIALAQLFIDEVAELEKKIAQQHEEIDELLYPVDPLNNRSVFLEIRAGTGGQEAALFAGDLMRMYTLYGAKQNWHVSLASESSTDLGGFKEVILHIEGKNVYGALKYESGVHRVQRVPKTETAGRIHTSTATVAVIPEADEIEMSVNPNDLRIDVFRASGAGGQHVNTTDSAVRITHIPTGLVVSCQDERSQHKNKAKALKILKSRLLAAQKEKQDAAMSQVRKDLVGTGMRSEKVRTYNFPQNRVTDHQVELTLKKLDVVLDGNLDEIIQALLVKEHEDARKKPSITY